MKVSIVTVSYNSSKTIKDTIFSVNSQTHPSIEHIFIDGASTDDTLEIIKTTSHRKNIIVSEPDNGIYDGMNKGILNSKGDIIIILNSDDILYNNNVVTDLVKIFKINQDVDIVYGNILFSSENNIRNYIRKWDVSAFRQGCFKNGWHPPHPGFVVKRNIYKQYGAFDLRYKIASDFDLMMRLLEVYKIPSMKYDGIISVLRYGGSSTNLKGIIKGACEIKTIFSKNNIKIFFPMYIIKRYLGKIKQLYK